MRVGFIGLGSQGGPMARAIVDARIRDHAVGPHARRRSSRTPTPRRSTRDSPAELAAASDMVCLCVVGDDDVRGLAYGDDGSAGGAGPGRDDRHTQHHPSRHLP